MSTFQPYIEAPIPNYALEEAARAQELAAVPEVTPTGNVRQVESEEERFGNEPPVVPDAMEISKTARALSENTAEERRARRTAEPEEPSRSPYNPVEEAGRIRANRAIRELIQGFENYDNGVAVEKYAAFLDLFSSYGAPAAATEEGSQLANVRARENALYYALGLSNPAELTDREMRDNMMLAIDRWMASVGIFLPGMLNYPSSDGFRFVPLTDQARASLRSADVMASYERARIAQYLRELAELTPTDFMFYDPTGLGDLPLSERRTFLTWMDRELLQAGVRERAAELRYVFENGRLAIGELGLDDQAGVVETLDSIAQTANDYYSILKDSVKQYGSGIISGSLT